MRRDWTYGQLRAVALTARDRSAGKPIKNNTRLLLDHDGTLSVRLHSTDIITILPPGHEHGTKRTVVVLDSGGWQTVTTKSRMNEYAPGLWRVWQDDFEWYVALEHAIDREHAYDYVDGFAYEVETGRVL